MPSPRSAQEFLRLLHHVESPVYFVAENRQLAFVNRACANWLGVDPKEIVGRICRYRSGDADPLTAAADSICPPPEVFHGKRTFAELSIHDASGTNQRRHAEFIPLASDDGNIVGALVIVDLMDLPENAGDSLPAEATDADEAARLHQVVSKFRAAMVGRHRLERLAGKTPAMQRVRMQIELAASCNATVLVVGPAGSGKQHVASTIHYAQSPPIGSLAPISCAVLPGEVLLSTLSALSKKHATATDGPPATLLLAEVQMMPAEVQAEVAHWLAAGPRNIRIIATSKLPQSSLVDQGLLRRDLAMLLSTVVIELAPLSSRRDDIPLVAQILLEDCNADSESKQLRGFSTEAMDKLVAYDWPGEIDELAGIVREAFAAAEGCEIIAADLPKILRLAAEAARFPRNPVEPIDLERSLARIETDYIERAMKQAKGNKTQAAKLLGLTRPRLYRRMVQLGLAQASDAAEDESLK
ncbi:MAG: sigma 54-interacting transcriptional regulator [Pirellulales bacterium]|nr:sigma 54-interacting transcriptional regulator [Pirellulales bacterium]